MFKMHWSQRGHDIYIVLKRTCPTLDFHKVEVSITDRSCFIRLPDGKKHSWNFFLEVNSKDSYRVENKDCLIIFVPKKDTTLYWPALKRSALTSQTISDDLFEEKRKFDKVVKHNDGQPPLKIANTGRNRGPVTDSNNDCKKGSQSLLSSGGVLMGGNSTSYQHKSAKNLASGDHSKSDSSLQAFSRSISFDSIRSDSYQTDEYVNVTLYVATVDPWSLKVTCEGKTLVVKFKTSNEKILSSLKATQTDELEWRANLHGDVKASGCSHQCTIRLLEIKLVKEEKKKWDYVFEHEKDQEKNHSVAKATSNVKKFPEKTTNTSKISARDEFKALNAVDIGFTGLNNLGNTCYLNSVVQALANAYELKEYFLGKHFEADINRTNPLGMGGKVAESFYEVVEALWSGNSPSFSPKCLRKVIGTKEARFNDYMQHDAQEFMAFLLDILHEDLNRVYDKPYYEIEEGVGKDDKIVAEKSWKLHKSRNDSKVVDLFHGLFKSLLVCPKCNKKSIKFDPFLFLPLPLPKSKRPLSVFCQLSDPYSLPIKVVVQISTERARAAEVFKQVSTTLKVTQDKLRMFEVVDGKLMRFFVPSSKIDDLNHNHCIFLSQALVFDQATDVPCFEIAIQHRYMVVHDTKSCVFCKASQEQNKMSLKRCTKCLGVAYCNQLCQKNDWPTHKFKCRRTFKNTSFPFIIRIPKDKWTYTDLCNNLTKIVLNRFIDVKFFKSNRQIQLSDLKAASDEFPLQLKPYEWNRMNNSNDLTPLQDQGEKPINLSENRFMNMDWLTDPSRQVYAVVEDYQPKIERIIELNDNSEQFHLHDCIKLFTEAEVLAPEEAWYCPQCKKHEQATKQLSLWSLPDILIIQLKRFSFKNYLWKDKIDRFIDFPINSLDMTSYRLDQSNSRCVYDLFAVVNHHGGLYGGHYTCYVRLDQGNDEACWRSCDDETVREVPASEVVSKSAYVMFYRRRKETKTKRLCVSSSI